MSTGKRIESRRYRASWSPPRPAHHRVMFGTEISAPAPTSGNLIRECNGHLSDAQRTSVPNRPVPLLDTFQAPHYRPATGCPCRIPTMRTMSPTTQHHDAILGPAQNLLQTFWQAQTEYSQLLVSLTGEVHAHAHARSTCVRLQSELEHERSRSAKREQVYLELLRENQSLKAKVTGISDVVQETNTIEAMTSRLDFQHEIVTELDSDDELPDSPRVAATHRGRFTSESHTAAKEDFAPVAQVQGQNDIGSPSQQSIPDGTTCESRPLTVQNDTHASVSSDRCPKQCRLIDPHPVGTTSATAMRIPSPSSFVWAPGQPSVRQISLAQHCAGVAKPGIVSMASGDKAVPRPPKRRRTGQGRVEGVEQ